MNSSQNWQENIQNGASDCLNWIYMDQVPLMYPPYNQFLHFYPFQQIRPKEIVEKKGVDAAVQTQRVGQHLDQAQSSQSMQSAADEATLKQFPLPNKEKLFQLFQCNSIKRREINQILNEICSDKTKPLNNFYRSVGEKIINFKKTKEQIIKFLVRRAWKKQQKGLDVAREKYYSKYKSMNTDYLSMVFNDSSFVSAYEEMLDKFDTEFDSFNLERFQRFYDYLLNCYVKNNLVAFKNSKQCKSKLPYPLIWKTHIYQVAQSLYETYYRKNSQKKKASKQNNSESSEMEG